MIEEQSVIKFYLSIKGMTEDSDVPVAHPNPSATIWNYRNDLYNVDKYRTVM
jgi:hypothetical protein